MAEKEYIDKETAIELLCDNINLPIDSGRARAYWTRVVQIKDALIRHIKTIPAADVVEVRHGEWIFDFELDGSNFYKCSVCGRQEVLLAKESTDEYFPYCHCGAKMDGATDNNVGGKQEVQK